MNGPQAPAPVLGIDVGGTKIAAGVVTTEGEVIARARCDTPRTGSGDDVVRAVVDLVEQVRREHPVAAVGLGVKGVVDTVAGVVLQDGDTLPGWGGTAVAGPVRQATGLPVHVDNDVRVTALAEATIGAAVGFSRVLVASVGTGVGGGFVVDGRVQHGAHGTTGEIAHLYVPGPGALPCGCGRRDHLEAVSAGPAIAAAYRDRTGAAPGTTLREVAAAAAAGDAVAAEVITAAAQVLGRALAGLATALDVDVLVIGGGVAQIGDGFVAPAAAAFTASVLEPLRTVPVVRAALGTDAPLVGAAALTGVLTGRPPG